MTEDFQGRTAIVTGAARGIGFAIARRLSEGGATVVVSDIDEAGAAAAAAQLPGAHAVACDVRDEDQVRTLVERTVADHGGLHVMVPNAGIASVAPLLQMDLAEWRKVMSINLDGVFLSMRYAAPAIIASGGGTIVNVASVTATAGTPLVGHYGAAKAAVVNLTKTAATELRAHGVRVNAVLPGFVATALVTHQSAAFEAALGMPSGGFDALIEQKQGRWGTEDEVARAVAFLASDESTFCNGSGLVLDGGLDAGLF
ncbi:oxidoreductase [Tsukamurella pulmonis]|uniref:SDR family NAD(P)-dependent oxidoreductase n=1 Tax=Tsukamurella pulmonis TaxID=47312 RepID=UPI000796FC8D|nr:glucose 1-dehydrogenase [Tsukamurella pulmonis]KXP12074.1 oxidoreductase [Tsukamurella pulmonis]RDH13426.1 SDR family oxidoreductase [Tsukamurella pulmonis]